MAAILKEDLSRPREHMPGLSKKAWTKFSSIEYFFSYFSELLYCPFIEDISQPLTPFLKLYIPGEIYSPGKRSVRKNFHNI